MKKWIVSALIIGASLVGNSAIASQAKFDAYVKQLKVEALNKGYSQRFVDEAFAQVQFRPKVVKADKNQPEKKRTLDDYIARAVPQWKINKGKALLKKHHKALQRIEQEYNVQPRFIVALWGIESNFGSYQGRHNIIDALTTMAFEGRREAFFKKELFAALEVVKQGHISFKDMKGSWAGAMGQPQFMPSSFLAYAVDGNNDGKKDIWATEEDVLASAANYLNSVGWDAKYTWGRQVRIPKSLSKNLIGRKKAQGRPLSQWSRYGVKQMNGRSLPKLRTDINAWLIAPSSAQGKSYLVYENYQALMRWNRSDHFGLAVAYLADAISP